MTQTGRKATLPKLGSSFTGSAEHFVIHYTDMIQSAILRAADILQTIQKTRCSKTERLQNLHK